MPVCKSTTPLTAKACKIPTEADEDCMSAVKTVPTKIAKIGLLQEDKNPINVGELRSADIELLIIFIPINSMPKPAIISPI